MARGKKDDVHEVSKKECLECRKAKSVDRDFYKHDAPIYGDNKYPICKTCIKSKLKLDDPMSQTAMESVKDVMLEMNKPFIYSLWIASIEEAKNTGKKDIFGLYKKNVDQNKATATWKDSEFEHVQANTHKEQDTEYEIVERNVKESSSLENRNREDVLKMLGYDPFEFENPEDKRQMYNRLVDMLDESTLEDGFKLQASIGIVKGFNQVDRIDQAIASITSDVNKLANNSGGIKTLIQSKKDILASLLKLAEDNGISVKHNNQKSKGAGTLSGIIKTLQEKGFEEGEVNLFDIETSQGMRQVADVSNKSIMAQLQFDENDYTAMLMEQREIIQQLDTKVASLEEENRLLKKEMIKIRKLEGGDING